MGTARAGAGARRGQDFDPAVAVHVGGAEAHLAVEAAERGEGGPCGQRAGVDDQDGRYAAVLRHEEFVDAVAIGVAGGDRNSARVAREGEELCERGDEREVGNFPDIEHVLIRADIGLAGTRPRAGDEERGGAGLERGHADFAGEVGVGEERCAQFGGAPLEDPPDVEVENLDVPPGAGPGGDDQFVDTVAVEVGARHEHTPAEAGVLGHTGGIRIGEEAGDFDPGAEEYRAVAVEDFHLRRAGSAGTLGRDDVVDPVAVHIAVGDANRTDEGRRPPAR